MARPPGEGRNPLAGTIDAISERLKAKPRGIHAPRRRGRLRDRGVEAPLPPNLAKAVEMGVPVFDREAGARELRGYGVRPPPR